MQTQHERALGRIASPRWLKRGLGALGLGIALSSGLPSVLAAPDVPLVVQAYKQAERPLLGKSVQATVTLTLLDKSSSQPGVLVAQGNVRMEGDILEGNLPMTSNDPKKVKPGSHSLRFNVTRQGRIGLQWLLNGKPLNGAAMKAFNTEATSTSLSGKVNWNGATRLATVTFSQSNSSGGFRLRPIRVVPLQIKPTPKPKPKPKPAPTRKPILIGRPILKLPKKAIGRRVKVTGRLVVTNSDDGLSGVLGAKDMRVELYGNIMFGNQTAFSLKNRSANDGAEFKSKSMNSVVLRYDDPNLHFFQVKGRIYDVDKASSSDTLWNASKKIDLLKILESNREYLIKGDRDSENADLYIRVRDEGEVF